MDVTQCRMGRAAVGWSWDDLASAAGIGRRTVARFETGETVSADSVEAMRRALEAQGVQFIMSGLYKRAVVPPAPKPIEDRSGSNPLLPRVTRAATDVAPNRTRRGG